MTPDAQLTVSLLADGSHFALLILPSGVTREWTRAARSFSPWVDADNVRAPADIGGACDALARFCTTTTTTN